MLILFTIILLVSMVGAIYVFTRPSVPKKYPIFTISDSIEDQYTDVISQLRNVANDSLSLYSTYNAEAFAQLVRNIRGKLDSLIRELDRFDAYWQHFARFKAQSSFVGTCETYSTSRRNGIRSAQQFIEDALPFMAVTSDIKRVQQAANNTVILSSQNNAAERVASLLSQTKSVYDSVTALNPLHSSTMQYRQYILKFLQTQIQLLEVCQHPTSDDTSLIESYNQYTDTWAHFNDTHTIDLVQDEFSFHIDAPQQAMQELRRQTDYDT